MNDKSELARQAVLSRLRRRHDRLTQLARNAERSQREPRPDCGQLPFAADVSRPPARLAENRAAEG
jgi:hypothetical protein